MVAIVVDQLAAWVADERWGTLPASGGFARLRREGVYVRDLRYAHAVTETAPGHAALYTACAPWRSGIVANEVIAPEGGTEPFLLDRSTRLLTPGGPLQRASVSAARLSCETLSDALRAVDPQATILSLSFKDRAAILPAGKHPTAALWFEPTLDEFATSSAVASAFPRWAVPLSDAAAVARATPRQWDLLDADFVRRHALGGDAAAFEGDFAGLGKTFPHPIARGDGNAFRATPFADDFLLGLGNAAVEESLGGGLEAGAGPLLLELSLSANDVIGHVFGPESWEAWDELLRLDASLGRFLARLDALVGPDGWSLVLSGDHGIALVPEAQHGDSLPWCKSGVADRWERPCAQASRVAETALLSALRIASELALGRGSWVAGLVDPYLVLTPAARALPGPRRQQLDRAIRAVLLRQPGIAQVFDLREVQQPCPPESDASIAALVCRSVIPGQGGDDYLVTAPGSILDQSYPTGAAHGSPFLFDRSVPLLARVPGKLPAGKTIEGPVGYETFARTVALALGLAFPAADTGADLRTAP